MLERAFDKRTWRAWNVQITRQPRGGRAAELINLAGRRLVWSKLETTSLQGKHCAGTIDIRNENMVRQSQFAEQIHKTSEALALSSYEDMSV